MKNTLIKQLTASLVLTGMLAATLTGQAMTTKQADTIMSTATGLIGKAYLWGGKDPTKGGLDCSGLSQWSYKQAGISIPTSAAQQYGACNKCVNTKTKAALLFFATDPKKPGTVTHVTISSGDGTNSIGANGGPNYDSKGNVISSYGKVVKFKFGDSYWGPKLLTCAMSSSW